MSDDDELFAQITDGLEIEPPDVEPTRDVKGMSDMELIDAHSEILSTLNDRGALLDPKTDEDKDLQTRYYAVFVEMKLRHLK